MGEIADAMLDGTLCQYCGAWMDDDIGGFPRSCGCEKEDAKAPRKKSPRTKTELDAYSVEQNRIQREGKAASRRAKRRRQRDRQTQLLAIRNAWKDAAYSEEWGSHFKHSVDAECYSCGGAWPCPVERLRTAIEGADDET